MGHESAWITVAGGVLVNPRVVYWNNIPSPYMVERFNALARRESLDFEAWFSARSWHDRLWNVDESSWLFRSRYLPRLPSVRNGPYPVAIPTPLLSGEPPDILVSLYASSSFVTGSMIAMRRGVRTALWVEVTYDTWVRRRWWKESLKAMMFPRVDAIITPGADGRDFARRYRAREDRIFIVPHVIDVEHFATASAIDPAARARLRKKLGLHGTTFIYVGRFLPGKGLTYLLDAFKNLTETSATGISLLLVGDGPDKELLREKVVEEKVPSVVFVGFQNVDSLPHFYAAADVFVFPTLGDAFGLVVLEAMACGLPVISTSAAGEIPGRVSEGENGFIVPAGDSKALHDRMKRLTGDIALRKRMSQASRKKVAGQTPDRWAAAFESAVEGIMSMSKATGGRNTRRMGLPGRRR